MGERFDLGIVEDAPTSRTTKQLARTDGWSNLTSGLGTTSDKRMGTFYSPSGLLTKEEWIQQYNGDGIIRRIIDIIPDDMMRQWGSFKDDPTDEYKDGILNYHMLRLQVPTMFARAKKWARLTGGSLVYVIATGTGAPDTPLTDSKIARINNIEGLRVFDLGDILTTMSEWDYEPTSPTYGQIIRYKVRVRAGHSFNYFDIHHTRCIPFFGASIPPSSKMALNLIEARYWGISELQFLYDDLRDFRSAFGSTALVLQEFIVGKYKFADLDEMLGAGGQAKLRARLEAIEMSKSMINAVMLGTDEDYTRDSATVTGIPDVLDRFMMLLSANTGIPVTKLFGSSAAGMNATGAGDADNYYDVLRSAQSEHTQYIQRLGDMLAKWLKLPDTYIWEWASLEQQSEEERNNAKRIESEVERTLADADQRYIQAGVISADDIYRLRFAEKMARLDAQNESIKDPKIKGLMKDKATGTPMMGAGGAGGLATRGEVMPTPGKGKITGPVPPTKPMNMMRSAPAAGGDPMSTE